MIENCDGKILLLNMPARSWSTASEAVLGSAARSKTRANDDHRRNAFCIKDGRKVGSPAKGIGLEPNVAQVQYTVLQVMVERSTL